MNERVDYITIIMNSTNHAGFLKFVSSTPQIIEAYKTSGQGCYLLKTTTANQNELNTILDDILKFANYQINSVITKHK